MGHQIGDLEDLIRCCWFLFLRLIIIINILKGTILDYFFFILDVMQIMFQHFQYCSMKFVINH